jgi:hypothetical protein
MTKRAKLFGLLVAVLCLAAEPLAALTCEQVCTPTTSCSRKCNDSGELINCGMFGVCAGGGGGGCVPNWQYAGFQIVSAFPDYSTGSCTLWYIVKWRMHDANQCGQPDYYQCETESDPDWPWNGTPFCCSTNVYCNRPYNCS